MKHEKKVNNNNGEEKVRRVYHALVYYNAKGNICHPCMYIHKSRKKRE